MLASGIATAAAKEGFDIGNPTCFFTRVASRLLAAELDVDLTRIQVYPTNQYSPALHRLLQVTANLYDATTNRPATGYPFLPSVFRPLFRRDSAGTVFIAGYREVQDARMAGAATAPLMVDLESSVSRTNIPLLGVRFDADDGKEPMVYGMPLVIGAKKGFPNFNQFALQNAITVMRRLSFHRESGQPLSRTNQAYSLVISNMFGAQLWNSYSNAFPRPLQIIVAADVTLSFTNEFGPVLGPDGSILSNRFSVEVVTNVPANLWSGFRVSPFPPNVSFQIPLFTNILFLTNSVYLQDSNRFFAMGVERPNYFPNPHWWLNVSERLRCILVDTTANRIVDYVNLSSSETPLNIMNQMMGIAQCGGIGMFQQVDLGDFWCTNRIGNPQRLAIADDPTLPTIGILNQMMVSATHPPMVRGGVWLTYNPYAQSVDGEIDDFVRRIYGDPTQMTDPADLDFSAPFAPTRSLYQYVDWSANDPLVHYTIPDLTDQFLDPTYHLELDVNNKDPVVKLTGLNPLPDHYRPWGGNPYNRAETSLPTSYNMAVKDPLVVNSDCWDFPSGEPVSFSNFGRIHRGTPWQTIYLKSADIDSFAWQLWSGNKNLADAMLARPVSDRHLIHLLASLLNTNAPCRLLSINDPDTNAWLRVLDGMTVVTNSLPRPATLTMSSNSPQAALIVAAIQQTRSSQANHLYQTLGDILATPALSSSSPWMNSLNARSAGTDEAYEIIPSQLLPLLREDSIGSVTCADGRLEVCFTGYDDCFYAVQRSSDLAHWEIVGIGSPENGVFTFTVRLPAKAPRQFYRSVLLGAVDLERPRWHREGVSPNNLQSETPKRGIEWIAHD